VDDKLAWTPAVPVEGRAVLYSGSLETDRHASGATVHRYAGGVLCDRYAFSHDHVSLEVGERKRRAEKKGRENRKERGRKRRKKERRKKNRKKNELSIF
jgi:hypothetical protein